MVFMPIENVLALDPQSADISVCGHLLQSQELPGMQSTGVTVPFSTPVLDEQTHGLVTEVSHNKPP